MYKKMSTSIVKKLTEIKIIQERDFDVYEYSFELLISTVVSTSLMLILAILFKKLFLSILFILGFITTRLSCGGFHAKTHFTCLLTTLANYLIFLFCISTIRENQIITILLIINIISVVTILLLAPVEHENNPMDETDIRRNKRRCMYIVLITSILTVLSVLFQTMEWAVLSINLGIFSVAVSVIIAKLTAHRKVLK